MKFQYLRSCSLLLLLTYLKVCCFAQNSKTKTASWILPSVTYQASPSVKFSAQFGINHYQRLKIFYLQTFIKSGKWIILNPSYLYINRSILNGIHIKEHTLMNSVIFNLSLNKILVDDRNVLWNRFRVEGQDFHFYRNRLRVTLPFSFKGKDAKIYVFDEASYFFNRARWSRNRIAVGVGYDVTKWLNTDISFVHEADVYNGKLNLFFITGTIQFFHKQQGSSVK
ncbi:MAG: DUF2490 domain-containing protein [Algoriphagus sp.]|nr:DUF2490 domain-containing protein [Algoriphagus sp.]